MVIEEGEQRSPIVAHPTVMAAAFCPLFEFLQFAGCRSSSTPTFRCCSRTALVTLLELKVPHRVGGDPRRARG